MMNGGKAGEVGKLLPTLVPPTAASGGGRG